MNLKWIISSPLVGPLDNLTLLIREVEQFLARLPVGILSFPKYLLGSKLPRISDAPRPPVCVKETGM